MIKIISISKLSNNLAVGAICAFILALSLMTGFQYANASVVNVMIG